jgi:hypothetical protein
VAYRQRQPSPDSAVSVASSLFFIVGKNPRRRRAGFESGSQTSGVKVLRPPVGAPTANAHCERLIGSLRRQCLDFIIPIDKWHLRRTLRQWSTIVMATVLIGYSDLASRRGLKAPAMRCVFLGHTRDRLPGSNQLEAYTNDFQVDAPAGLKAARKLYEIACAR